MNTKTQTGTLLPAVDGSHIVASHSDYVEAKHARDVVKNVDTLLRGPGAVAGGLLGLVLAGAMIYGIAHMYSRAVPKTNAPQPKIQQVLRT